MDITKMSVEELWKIAFEQQELITNSLAQIQQAQANIKAIKEEIEKRKSNVTNTTKLP
jgi:peptidoglycan hydrolase CwlO-like protein